jgi:maltose alpha-D-glucosyltransferase/alpha-amylase
MEIINHAVVALPEYSTVFFLIQVTYQSGLPDIYQLPVSFAHKTFALRLQDTCPKAVISNATVDGIEGVLYDALFGAPLQEALLRMMAENQQVTLRRSKLIFSAHESVGEQLGLKEPMKPRVLSGEQSNTSLVYGNRFYVKIFRKVDLSINPDVEITQFLTEHTSFRNIPAFLGAIEWRFDNGSLVMGMMQEMVESSGDAWVNMFDRLNSFNENILISNRTLSTEERKGTLVDPVSYDAIPDDFKELIDAATAEQASLLGVRTGEMHIALASGTAFADFNPEPYSLHYQRSLYAGLQSLVRGTFLNQRKNLQKLDEEVRKKATEVLAMKDEILEVLRHIYKRKIDVTKIRIHGDYHLGQVLFTGKDFIITDFEGEPARSYSERRLKRSPLRDVAGMIRSFHYAAYASLVLDSHIRKEDFSKLIPFIEQWYHYMSGFFMKSYLETVEGSAFVPKNKEDLETLMTTFLLEKAIYELNYELNNRPGWVMIPLRGIEQLMNKKTASAPTPSSTLVEK